MGIDSGSSPWSLCMANGRYSLCNSYPAILVQPKSTTERDLRGSASFRMHSRLPTMSWCGGRRLDNASLWRCAQTSEGLFGNACPEDERLVAAIRHGAEAGQDRELLIMDLRPRASAYANKVGGGGFESYAGCRLLFGGIDAASVVRDAWRLMGQAVSNLCSGEVGSWFRDVANSGWYDQIAAILSCARLLVAELHEHRCNALVHCSDGWDSTAQVTALAMLCLDPHYRTLRGFMLLIQKEFCSFGHRFRTRLANGEKPSSEYSPIFLQWLECVYQLTLQCETAFEFSSALLVQIGREALSNRFGTFLVDSERERAQDVMSHTRSLWAWLLNMDAKEHINSRYVKTEEVLSPSPTQVGLVVWEDYWFRHRLHPRDERPQ